MLCVLFGTTVHFAQAAPIVIGNNSPVDFSSLLMEGNKDDFVIENKGIKEMISGEIQVLISDVKWDNDKMADYQQRYGSHPQQIIIAAFNDTTDATMQQQAEVFSTRAGSKLLYMYISELAADGTNQEMMSFFTEKAQPWFSEQGLMMIPDVVYQQNLVTLGLKEPLFKGGYQ